MYGGITLLGILTTGKFGIAPGGLALDDAQRALFRAGHAHAGGLGCFFSRTPGIARFGRQARKNASLYENLAQGSSLQSQVTEAIALMVKPPPRQTL